MDKGISELVHRALSAQRMGLKQMADLLGVAGLRMVQWATGVDGGYGPPNKYHIAALKLLADGVRPSAIMFDSPNEALEMMRQMGVTATTMAIAAGVSENAMRGRINRCSKPNLTRSIMLRESMAKAKEIQADKHIGASRRKAIRDAIGQVADGSAARLAAMLGVQAATVRRWVRGKHDVPASAIVAISALRRGVDGDRLGYTGDDLGAAVREFGGVTQAAFAMGVSTRTLADYAAYGSSRLPKRIALAMDEAIYRRKYKAEGEKA